MVSEAYLEAISVSYRTSPETGRLYTHEELMKAWELLGPMEYWKGPIDCIIDAKNWDIVSHTIVYCTATHAEYKELPDGRYHVTAPGYWAGPCGS